MGKGVEKLRLGPLPRADMVKLTITVSAETKAALDRYASLHSQLHGERIDTLLLIPHMLEAFIARDRGFKSMSGKALALRRDVAPGPVAQVPSNTTPGVDRPS